MKSLKKLELTFSALLLTATVAAFSQGTQGGEVALRNGTGTIVSWSDFVKAVNDPSSITVSVPEELKTNLDNAKDAYDDAKTAANEAAMSVRSAEDAYNGTNHQLTLWNDSIVTLNTESTKTSNELNILRNDLKNLEDSDAPMSTASWLTEVIQKVNVFQGYFNAIGVDNRKAAKGAVYYKVDKSESGNILYLSFTENSGDLVEAPITAWALYDIVFSVHGQYDGDIREVYVYLSDKYTESSNHYLKVDYNREWRAVISDILNALSILENSGKYKEPANQKEIDEKRNEIAECEEKLRTIDSEIERLTKKKEDADINGLYAAWQNAIADQRTKDREVTIARDTLNAAQEAYDKAAAEAVNDYKKVKLNGDVIATETIEDFDGCIDGQGHVISVTVPQLFNSCSGTLLNVGINGRFAKSIPTAKTSSVACWDSNNNDGVYYDAKGDETGYATIGALGFAARSSFGADLTADKLVGLTDESKVYSITVYEPEKVPVQMFVQLKDSKIMTGSGAYTIPVNMFAKSETTDLEGIDNVFFSDGTCKRVVIVDRKKFYCPQTINAKEVVYDRKFQKGSNSVCLPFELTGTDNGSIRFLCRYDKETDDKFWFKKIADAIPANTPMLLVAENDFELKLNDIQIAQTPEKLRVVDEENENADGSKAYGIFKPTSRDEFQGGASEAHRVYGMTAIDGTFNPAAEGARFPSFRMVIYSRDLQPSGKQKPRKIAIMDENGEEITDITTSTVDTAEVVDLEIATASGQIIISSEAELGLIAIYAVDGRVAAMANVKSGITATIDVEPGIYLVMGKKVMVNY